MNIRLKYARPMAPGAQVNLNLGYPIELEVQERTSFEDDYGEVQYSTETVLRPKTSIFLDKTSEIEIPLSRENVEAIEKLTTGLTGKGMFKFADGLSQESFEQGKSIFSKSKAPKKIAPPKKEVAVEKLEAKEL